jgi:NAD-dependent dihydropyrimidine dehydrogenase PreA subunit
LCKLSLMTYVIGLPCVDVLDRACVDECPVDCIYEGARSLYIHPDECVDCGACEPVCPVEAIYYEDDLPSDLAGYLADNERFFTEPLANGRAPLGSPGGAAKLGAVGADTAMVAALPPQLA